MKKNIVIVDDNLLIRKALVAMIENDVHYTIVGEANNGEEAIAITKQHKPEIIILDINMPIIDGEEAAKEIVNIVPDSTILALSGMNDKSRIAQLFGIGIDGFLSKDDITQEELSNALQTIVDGDIYLSPQLFATEIENGISIENLIEDSNITRLTKRERGILLHLTEGLSNIQIGEKLFISDKTVAKHRENIMRKSSTSNIAQLINYAKEAGFIK